MKKLPILLVLLAAAGGAQAQLGIKAGLNAAVLNGSRIDADTRYKTSYHAGVFYESKLLGPLSIQPELQYSLQGATFKSAVADYKANLHYLHVPVLAKLRLGGFFAEAGPQFGVLLKAREEGRMATSLTDDGSIQYADASRGAWNSYKKTDVSLCVGAGFKLLGGLSFGARFVAGLNDINDAQTISGVNDSRLKNRLFQGYAAFQLP